MVTGINGMGVELIDTHAHLDYPDFESDLEAVVGRAAEAGVTRIISIGTGPASSCKAVALAERFPNLYASIGIHPTNVIDEGVELFPLLRELAHHPKVVAIGETGIDYHHVPEGLEDERLWKVAQEVAFGLQLDLAEEVGLNVVIHQRSAWEETLAVLRPYTGRVRGVFHCFGGTPEQAEEIASLGHLVSFTGIISFKNAAQVRETAARVSADGYMVETDCPYLAPVPHRGKRAEPAHTRIVAEQVALARGISVEEVAAATTRTAEKFFRFRRLASNTP